LVLRQSRTLAGAASATCDRGRGERRGTRGHEDAVDLAVVEARADRFDLVPLVDALSAH
jgi:hypothetical protein